MYEPHSCTRLQHDATRVCAHTNTLPIVGPRQHARFLPLAPLTFLCERFAHTLTRKSRGGRRHREAQEQLKRTPGPGGVPFLSKHAITPRASHRVTVLLVRGRRRLGIEC